MSEEIRCCKTPVFELFSEALKIMPEGVALALQGRDPDDSLQGWHFTRIDKEMLLGVKQTVLNLQAREKIYREALESIWKATRIGDEGLMECVKIAGYALEEAQKVGME